MFHTTVFSTGERFPVLLYRETYQPVVLPMRYVIDMRRETKQSGTVARDVRVLKWLFEWTENIGIDLETRLKSGESLTVTEITGFCRYLRSQRTDVIAGSINPQGENVPHVLSPNIFNSYIAVVENFLEWAAHQYIPLVALEGEVMNKVLYAKERIRQAFDSHRLGRTARYKQGLNDEDLAKLRKVIKPGAHHNPFKRSTQFRNYVLIELLLATGIRRGELLKIKLDHLPRGPKKTVTIERSPDDKLDNRKEEPQVKTLEREIPIPSQLAVALWEYVGKYRNRGCGDHPYLFTSSRSGAPLVSVGVNSIFNLLVEKCLPELKGRLHPHILRYTFNDRLVTQAIELGWGEEQLRRTQTYLNGWTEGSVMPEHYTKRIIQAKAMELAEKYQRNLYNC